MQILIIGGTVFLGRHLVEAAQARGHAITLFNRGQHNPELFPEVEKLRGDRGSDLSALAERRWDAAIDTCGYVPRVVRASAELLADAVEHYTFVSSISVYADFKKQGINESDPVGTLADETVEEVTGESYGPLKALCEQAAERAMPGRVLNARPGLIVGPHDPTDRFTYWPRRVAQGGAVLAPNRPEHGTQIIDVRDLADWMIAMAEERRVGIYNATGPEYHLTIGHVLDESKAVSGSDARFVWVSERFLLDAGVQPWGQVPLWVPEEDPDNAGFDSVDCTKAIDAGLHFRPLAETIGDTLAWDATLPADRELRAGLTREREAELLQAWHNRT
jgi:nucleoside-diphosphate-sugar epimerase